jgi:WD40 repeat protein
MPNRVIQAAHHDAGRELLATATWGEIRLHRVDRDQLRFVSKTRTTGDVRWIAVGGSWLAAWIAGGEHTGITMWSLDGKDQIDKVEVRHPRNVQTAALSRDGRYLAFATDGDTILVHSLDTDTYATFDEHTDDVTAVRFTGDDHVLVTADADNRIVMRPRTKTGYARPVMPVEIPDAMIDP